MDSIAPTIVSSTYVEGNAQADGRRYVAETHTASDGQTFKFEYLAELDADCSGIATERAAVLNQQLSAKAATQAAILGTALPMTVYEFLKRFTTSERIAVRNKAKTDAIVDDFMDLLNRSGAVYPANPDVTAGLNYLVSVGVLTSARAAVIGAA
jgi:hypothetical protein